MFPPTFYRSAAQEYRWKLSKLPCTLPDTEVAIATPQTHQCPELANQLSFQPGFIAGMACFLWTLKSRSYNRVPPRVGSLRWSLRRDASGGVRSWSSCNGSGRTRTRRGLSWWFVRCGPGPVAAVVLALGKGLSLQDQLRCPPNSRTG